MIAIKMKKFIYLRLISLLNNNNFQLVINYSNFGTGFAILNL